MLAVVFLLASAGTEVVIEAPKGASKEPICGGRRRVFAASGTGGGGTAITGALSTLSRTPCARSQSERSASSGRRVGVRPVDLTGECKKGRACSVQAGASAAGHSSSG